MKFKDDATGNDGVFDPGSNTVGLSIKGLGRESLKLSGYYFGLIEKNGIDTHFISLDMDNAAMTVKPARPFGKGLEVICRFKAVGSFYRRYGGYVAEGQDLGGFVEMTFKDDARQDPPVTRECLVMLGVMTDEIYNRCCSLAKEIALIIKGDLAGKGLELYDIKFEFGVADGKVILIDEISGGNMRVYRNGAFVQPMELADLVLLT